MLEPRIFENETERLAALRRLGVLDTPPEERFDRLTRLAKDIFDVPIALVSLVDEDRQWFKSRQGLDACETPRQISFCGHAIHADEIFHVPDALDDPRFADNPLVVGDPHVRFYAGAPLTTPDGHRVGTLCLIDEQPRELDARDRRRLRDLADCVEEELKKAALQDLLRLVHRHEKALIAAKEKAEESNRMKSEFLNIMSHELRTPLTVVLGYLPLLRDPAAMPPPETIAGIAQDMRAAGAHLLHLINDVLDLSKIEAGQMTLDRRPVPLAEAVAEVFDQLRQKAETKGLALDAELDAATVYADPLRLRQVLINLVGNAIKFTDRGAITVAARAVAVGVELRVADTGIGIPEDDLEAVFDRFRQVDASSTRKAGGSGLGLAITRSLVELHGGAIAAASRVGEGTTFTLTIPDGDPEPAPDGGDDR